MNGSAATAGTDRCLLPRMIDRRGLARWAAQRPSRGSTFLLAGSASTNPVLFTLAVGLMLAWKVAGYYGVDRYLLPRLGTPWRPGTIVRREAGPAPG